MHTLCQPCPLAQDVLVSASCLAELKSSLQGMWQIRDRLRIVTVELPCFMASSTRTQAFGLRSWPHPRGRNGKACSARPGAGTPPGCLAGSRSQAPRWSGTRRHTCKPSGGPSPAIPLAQSPPIRLIRCFSFLRLNGATRSYCSGVSRKKQL